MLKNWKVSSILVIITAAIIGGITGFTGSNLTIDNGRIEFINTSHSIYIGQEAGNADDTNIALPALENHNIGIGRQALLKVKGLVGGGAGTRNTCTGGHCMHDLVSGMRNTCTGTACLYTNIVGNQNITSGYHSGARHKTDNAVLIGAFAEEMNENAYGSVSIGDSIARNNQGKKNVLIGAGVAASSTNINNSVFIGNSNSRQQIQGDNNINIGYDQSLSDLNGSNQLNIGGVIRSDNVYTGHVRLRQGAGLELTNNLGDTYRITVDSMGNIDITFVN